MKEFDNSFFKMKDGMIGEVEDNLNDVMLEIHEPLPPYTEYKSTLSDNNKNEDKSSVRS